MKYVLSAAGYLSLNKCVLDTASVFISPPARTVFATAKFDRGEL